MIMKRVTPSPTEANEQSCSKKLRTYNNGAWSEREKLLFLLGFEKYGNGQWKEIGRTLKTRSCRQIKGHGQKIAIQQQKGRDVFAPLHRARREGKMNGELEPLPPGPAFPVPAIKKIPPLHSPTPVPAATQAPAPNSPAETRQKTDPTESSSSRTEADLEAAQLLCEFQRMLPVPQSISSAFTPPPPEELDSEQRKDWKQLS